MGNKRACRAHQQYKNARAQQRCRQTRDYELVTNKINYHYCCQYAQKSVHFRGLRAPRPKGAKFFCSRAKMPPAVRMRAAGNRAKIRAGRFDHKECRQPRAQGPRSPFATRPVICCFSHLASTTESPLTICVNAKSPTSKMRSRDKPSKSMNPGPERPTPFI